MYDWPISEIERALDGPTQSVAREEVRNGIIQAGYGPRLADFLADFYVVANGGTFYKGAFRVLPLKGIEKARPSLIQWNDPNDWKQYAPAPCGRAFFLLANAFGDLLGVPLNDQNDFDKDTTCVLWVEKYKWEVSALGWSKIFRKFLANESHMATFLARLKEYQWAVKGLGHPNADQCFSWNLLPSMGGNEDIKNLRIVSTYVNLSFSLQAYKQFLELNKQQQPTSRQ